MARWPPSRGGSGARFRMATKMLNPTSSPIKKSHAPALTAAPATRVAPTTPIASFGVRSPEPTRSRPTRRRAEGPNTSPSLRTTSLVLSPVMMADRPIAVNGSARSRTSPSDIPRRPTGWRSPGTAAKTGVAVTVIVRPLRRIVTWTGWPTCFRVNWMIVSGEWTAIPWMATISSPGRNPAMTAGETSRFRVGSIVSILGRCSFGAPMATKKKMRNRRAITKCVTGPARMTMARCHTGLAPNVRGYSSGVGSWKGFIPAIRTYPPAGMALNPYSVSPRRKDHSRGPNPTKNSSTLIPNSLAEKKWPASWTITTTMRTTMKRVTPRVVDTGDDPFPEALQRLDDLGGSGPGPPVCPVQGDLGDDRSSVVLVEDRGHHFGDLDQPVLPFEECHDGNFVRRIQRGGVGQAQPSRPIGQIHRWKRVAVQLLEAHPAQRCQIEPPDPRPQAIGEGQGELDGQAHVGGGHLGDHAAVRELGDAVDDRFGVHDHVDVVVLEAKQVVRLDHLEALVHKGGRVDGYLRAHLPRGMGQGLLHRGPGQLVT